MKRRKILAADLFCGAGGTSQGFEDTYQFAGNREAVVKQIGNAVPPPMARALALEVLR